MAMMYVGCMCILLLLIFLLLSVELPVEVMALILIYQKNGCACCYNLKIMERPRVIL